MSPVGQQQLRLGHVFAENVSDVVEGLARLRPESKESILGRSKLPVTKWLMRARSFNLHYLG